MQQYHQCLADIHWNLSLDPTLGVLIKDCEQGSIVQHIATMGMFLVCLGGASEVDGGKILKK